MLELSLNGLKLVAKSRGIKSYKSMSKEILLSAFIKSELAESKNSFYDETLKKATKYFNDKRLKKISDKKGRFSKPSIKEIRKSLYDIKNLKNLQHEK